MTESNKKEVGARLAQVETHLGISANKLATAIGIDSSQFSKIKMGKLGLPNSALTKLRNIYQVNTNWLLFGEGAWNKIPQPGTPETSEELLTLIQSNSILAEAHLKLANANSELVDMLKVSRSQPTAYFAKEIDAAVSSRLTTLLDAIASLGIGTEWQSKEEGLAELSRRMNFVQG